MELTTDVPDLAPDCTAGVLRHATREHTHRVMQGYWILLASTALAKAPENRGQGPKSVRSSATVALDLTDSQEKGPEPESEEALEPGNLDAVYPLEGKTFEEWLTNWVVPRLMSRRTALNYRTAALNCGITAGMTEAEAQKLAVARLTGLKSLKALYTPEIGGTEEEKEARRSVPGERRDKQRQMLFDFMKNDFCPLFSPQSKYLRALGGATVREVEEQLDHLKNAVTAVENILAEKTTPAGGKGRRGA